MSKEDRPIVMSIVQYTDAIESKKMTVMELVEKAGELGVDGVELRRELWGDEMNEELPAIKQRINALSRLQHTASFSVREKTTISYWSMSIQLQRLDRHTCVSLVGPCPKRQTTLRGKRRKL